MIRFRYDAVHRLESDGRAGDLAGGFAAPVADPAWMLGRQWQLGELTGEDAASPVRVAFTRHVTPLELVADGGPRDPRQTPPEALVESEPEEWWTVSRRVRVGRGVEAAIRERGEAVLPTDDPALRLADLPVPYRALDGTGYDGRQLWRRRTELGLRPEWFSPTPPDEPDDLWDPAELVYDADFRAGGAALPLRRHDGGDLDWYSVDATGTFTPDEGEAHTSLCSRVRYPGAPTPRWWELEDAALDVGGRAPDRAHFGTLLVIEALASHSDDWFTFPVDTVPGSVLTLDEAHVVDVFGDTKTLRPPADGWSLFSVQGLDGRSLIVWPTAASPLIGPLQDEVVLGVDEEAGTLWAVERRIAGRDVATEPIPTAPAETTSGAASGDGNRRFDYLPAPPVPHHWHPYVIDDHPSRRYVQGRLADLSGDEAVYAPVPAVDLLYDRRRGEADPVHRIEPSTVPRHGLRLERRQVLARRADGRPVLWSERQRSLLTAPPGLALHFDQLEASSRSERPED